MDATRPKEKPGSELTTARKDRMDKEQTSIEAIENFRFQFFIDKSEAAQTGQDKEKETKEIVQIGACMGNTAVLLSSGEMIVCGAGKLGQLGVGKKTSAAKQEEGEEEEDKEDLEGVKLHVDRDQFMQVEYFYGKAKPRVRQMGCGKFHFVVVDDAGNAYSWGFNKFGQLGLGIISKCEYEPARITNLGEKN